ncbi:MAG: GBS Bsp-like repeat-containing protein, partial [Roseburia sp.]|nr:GBS Bsp-like repeat-containing protein [Roseburia sp.]
KMGSKVLTEDVDYTVSYSNNRNVGTARVIISGIGVYSGEKVVTFVIKEKSIENCTVLAVASQTYNGRLLTPPVVVKDGTTMLKENVDYKLSYRDNYSVGTAYVTITGIGDYKGSVTKSFAITEPVLTSDVIVQSRNAAAGTFDIVVDGIPSYVTSVSVPVWTKADQSDIVWYNHPE